MKADQENVKDLLRDAIVALCRDTLSCKEEIVVEGLLGITVDKKDVFLVAIHESFSGPNNESVPCDKITGKDVTSLLLGNQFKKADLFKKEQNSSIYTSADEQQSNSGGAEGTGSFNLTVQNVEGNANYYYNQSASGESQLKDTGDGGHSTGSENSGEPSLKKRRRGRKPLTTVRLVLAGNKTEHTAISRPAETGLSTVQPGLSTMQSGLSTMQFVLANGEKKQEPLKIAVVEQPRQPQTVNIMGQMVEIKQERPESETEEDQDIFSNLYESSHWQLTPDHIYSQERPLYSPQQGRRGTQIMMHEFGAECGDHRPCIIPPTPRRSHPQKRCRVCYRKGTRKESRYCCPVCPGLPGLCVMPCFSLYHSDNQFHSQNSEIEIITETDIPEALQDGSITMRKEIIRKRCKPGLPMLTDADSYIHSLAQGGENSLMSDVGGELTIDEQRSSTPIDMDIVADTLSRVGETEMLAVGGTLEVVEVNRGEQRGGGTLEAVEVNPAEQRDSTPDVDLDVKVDDDTSSINSPKDSGSDSNAESSPRAKFLRLNSPRTYSRRKKTTPAVLYKNAEETDAKDSNSSIVNAETGNTVEPDKNAGQSVLVYTKVEGKDQDMKSGAGRINVQPAIKPGESILLNVLREMPPPTGVDT